MLVFGNMLQFLQQSFDSLLRSDMIVRCQQVLDNASQWVENTVRSLFEKNGLSFNADSFKTLKKNTVQAVILLTAFYAMFAIPMVGPILHFVLGTAQGTLFQTAMGYLKHLAFFGVQAALTYFIKPENLMSLGDDFLRQAYAFPLALLMGSFSRQVMFIAQPVVRLIGFYAGSHSVASAIVALAMAGLTAVPIFLLSNHNNSESSKKPGILNTFSLSQMVMMAYSSLIGSCFPQFSFGESHLSRGWRFLGGLTGASDLKAAQGHAAIDAAYDHFVKMTVPVGCLAGLFFSKPPQEPSSNTATPEKSVPLASNKI